MNDLLALATDAIETSNRMMLAGIKAERDAMRPRLSALVKAYDRAKDDPMAVIPTELEVLIESFRRDLENEYADTMVRRDIAQRHEGRSDHDMSASGMQLCPR